MKISNPNHMAALWIGREAHLKACELRRIVLSRLELVSVMVYSKL